MGSTRQLFYSPNMNTNHIPVLNCTLFSGHAQAIHCPGENDGCWIPPQDRTNFHITLSLHTFPWVWIQHERMGTMGGVTVTGVSVIASNEGKSVNPVHASHNKCSYINISGQSCNFSHGFRNHVHYGFSIPGQAIASPLQGIGWLKTMVSIMPVIIEFGGRLPLFSFPAHSTDIEMSNKGGNCSQKAIMWASPVHWPR